MFTTPICGNNVKIEQNIAKKRQKMLFIEKKIVHTIFDVSFISALTEKHNGIKGMYY